MSAVPKEVELDLAQLGPKIDELEKVKAKLKKIADEEKVYKEQRFALEEEILALLGEAGLDKASGKRATVTRSEAIVGQMRDREKFNKYIKQHGAFELYESRISSAAFREHLELRKGRPIPGTEKFTKVTLRLTAR